MLGKGEGASDFGSARMRWSWPPERLLPLLIVAITGALCAQAQAPTTAVRLMASQIV